MRKGGSAEDRDRLKLLQRIRVASDWKRGCEGLRSHEVDLIVGSLPDRGALRTRMKNMKLIYFSLVLAGTVFLFTSCERKSETVVEARVEEPIKAEPTSATTTSETTGLERAIEAYRANPTEQNGAGVDKALAELDLEIAELKQKGATATGNEKIETDKKLSDLQAYRNKQRAKYIGEKAKAAAASAGEAIKNATEDVGRAIEKTGEAVKKAVD